MTYIPHTDSDREAMLKVVGVKRLEDLFQDVPARHRFPKLDLPPALSEMETLEELQDIAAANENTRELVSFLGAGAYNHYIPAAVDSCCGAASSIPPIPPTSRKFRRAPCRPSLNIKAWWPL